MNREKIQKVRDHIAGLPDERFDMRFLYTEGGEGGAGCRPAILNECGTAACIAGWAGAVLAPEAPYYDSESAEIDFGLRGAGDRLFTPRGYLTGIHTRAWAVATLDHLLETGTVDWDAAKARLTPHTEGNPQ